MVEKRIWMFRSCEIEKRTKNWKIPITRDVAEVAIDIDLALGELQKLNEQ